LLQRHRGLHHSLKHRGPAGTSRRGLGFDGHVLLPRTRRRGRAGAAPRDQPSR